MTGGGPGGTAGGLGGLEGLLGDGGLDGIIGGLLGDGGLDGILSGLGGLLGDAGVLDADGGVNCSGLLTFLCVDGGFAFPSFDGGFPGVVGADAGPGGDPLDGGSEDAATPTGDDAGDSGT